MMVKSLRSVHFDAMRVNQFSSDEIELLQSHHARLAEYAAISGRLSQSFLSSLREQISNKFSKKNRWGAGRKMWQRRYWSFGIVFVFTMASFDQYSL
jgi:hypothetical protein